MTKESDTGRSKANVEEVNRADILGTVAEDVKDTDRLDTEKVNKADGPSIVVEDIKKTDGSDISKIAKKKADGGNKLGIVVEKQGIAAEESSKVAEELGKRDRTSDGEIKGDKTNNSSAFSFLFL